MSETNEFVNKLMNKNNSELDSLLSSAEKKKGKKRKKAEADKILEEVLNETRSVSEPEKTGKLYIYYSRFWRLLPAFLCILVRKF